MDRRSLILSAAFGTAVPCLVQAKSLLDLPGDPLTKRGLFAARKWAEESYRAHPAVRLVFANGESTRWHEYPHLSRGQDASKTYAVAIEVSACDVAGKRFVTSVPVDAVASERLEAERVADAHRRWNASWAASSSSWGDDGDDNDLPF